MNPVDPARVQALCQEALAYAGHIDRHRFLTSACGDDAGLWNAVWDTLRAHAAREAAHTPGTGAAGPGQNGERTGDVLGDCHLLQIVGEGVATTVWMAERYSPATTCMAVKVVNVGANDFLMRHEALRHTLGRLEHPHIARAHDVGMTRGGRPFVITDLVSGVPITQFCDEQKLPLSARVRLFAQVCETVHEAHEKGVAHGGLKPGNILVWWSDEAQPVFKITDFGFAQAMGQSVITAGGHPRSPAAYLAPEQIGTGKAEVKGDLVALAALLFELLTGRLPFTIPTAQVRTLEDLRRTVRDAAPLRASECLHALPKAQLTAIALARRLEPSRLLSLAEAHFDALLLRAMQKQPHARVESARAMAEALQGYLKGAEEEEFHADGLGSDVGSFIDRNRSMFVVGLGIVAVLIGFFSLVGWLWLRDKRPDSPASTARRNAEGGSRSAAFLENMFTSLTPERIKGKDTTLVKEMLDDAAGRLDELDGHPETQARMQETIGLTYLAMSHTTPAQTHLQGALETRREVLGPDHRDTMRSMRELATVFKEQGRLPEAASLLRKTLDTQKRVLGPEHPDTFITITVLAAVCEAEEQPLTSEQLFTGLWKLQKKVLGPDHLETLGTMGSLAGLLGRQGRHDEAIKLEEERLERTQRTQGARSPRTVAAMTITASAYESGGQPSEAEKMYAASAKILEEVLGADHPGTLEQVDQMARLQRQQGRPGQALALDQQSLEARRRTLGAAHPDTLLTMRHVAEDLDAGGKPAAAETMQQDVLEILRSTSGPDHAATLEQTHVLAQTYERHGRAAEAAALRQHVVQARRQVLGSTHPQTVAALTQLAGALSLAGRQDEAEKAQAEAVACTQAALGAGDPDTLAQMLTLARMQQQHGHLDQAEATLNSILQIQHKAMGPQHPDTQLTMHCMAAVRLAQKRPDDAEKIYRDSLEIERERKPENPLLLAECTGHLGRLWLNAGRALDAEPLLRECLELRKKHPAPDWRLHCTESLLGHALLQLHKVSEAGPLLRSGYEGLQARRDTLPTEEQFHLRDSLERMARYVEITQGPAAAAAWKDKLAQLERPRPLALR